MHASAQSDQWCVPVTFGSGGRGGTVPAMKVIGVMRTRGTTYGSEIWTGIDNKIVRETGKGDYIDISMLDSTFALLLEAQRRDFGRDVVHTPVGQHDGSGDAVGSSDHRPAPDGGRRGARQRRQIRRVAQHGHEQLADVVTFECALAREHFVKHDAEAEDVAAAIYVKAARLFGCEGGRRLETGASRKHRHE